MFKGKDYYLTKHERINYFFYKLIINKDIIDNG